MIKSKKVDSSLIKLIKYYENTKIPVMPISADLLMKEYKIYTNEFDLIAMVENVTNDPNTLLYLDIQ